MAKRVLNYPCWLHVRLTRAQRSAFETACKQHGIPVNKRSAVIRELISQWANGSTLHEAPLPPIEPEHDEPEQTDTPPVRCPYCGKQVTVNEDDGTWHCASFRGCGKRGRLGESVE